MVEPLRHRQTKEAETDMSDLQPPRHISTLPIAPFRTHALNGRFRGEADVDRSSPLANRDANDPTETSTGHSDCRCRGDYRVLVWVRANALS